MDFFVMGYVVDFLRLSLVLCASGGLLSFLMDVRIYAFVSPAFVLVPALPGGGYTM